MLKHILLTLAVAACITSYAATGDTTIIATHTNTNLASPPSDDDVWAVFPSTGSYQRIIMKFTLGCGTPNCSGWDYTVNTSFGKKNGALDSAIVSIDTLALDTTWSYSDHVEFIEAGRLITPYGTYMAAGSNGYNNSWTHPYYYDVTDYIGILRDSVNVRVHYDGWTDAFSAKIEFILIEGEPSRTVENVREIYHSYMGYANSADFESQATPQTFSIAPQVTSAKVLVIMTGHGSQGEFDPHNIHLKVNSNTVYTHLLWKDDCGMNAIAPQGGTWIFNRANWCPGEQVPFYEIDITPYIIPGQNVTLDLDMDDFAIQNGESAGYGISAHLITYTAQYNNDVMLEEIISPNSDKPYLRHNPISTEPKVKIKNMGKLPLTHADVEYWVKGGNHYYYEWTGTLAPFESALITLPPFDWNGLDTFDRVFYAKADWPNSVPDEYAPNNELASAFLMAPKLDSAFFIYFKANDHPEENWYIVRNEAGDTISFKNSFTAGAILRDTLNLEPGSYVFDFNDYDAEWGGGDGVSWWLNTQNNLETSGQLSLRKMNGNILKNFNGDFGSNIHYEFTVGYPLGYNAPKPIQEPPIHSTGIANVQAHNLNLSLQPNPASNVVVVQVSSNVIANANLVLSDITGKVISETKLAGSSQYQTAIPVAHLAKGLYFVSVYSNGTTSTKKLVVE